MAEKVIKKLLNACSVCHRRRSLLHSISLSLDLLTRSDSVPCPMAVSCGHACGSALRQSGGEIISTRAVV